MSTIRIFCSSPGDVLLEREQLGAVVEELNTALRAFAPEKGVALELVRWETHTYPDVGSDPQAVVDAQLGEDDFDVFVGMMWSRFGSPTSRAGSGTEHEFRNAYAGWERKRRPAHILFYFCEEPYPATLALESAVQLQAIHDFRLELTQKGLIGSYGTHAGFGDKLRRDLVLVVSRMLHAGEPPSSIAEGASRTDKTIARERVAMAAREYEQVRASMPSGDSRTRAMEVVASSMKTMAQSTFSLIPDLVASESPGERLAAVTALEVIPDVRYVAWLADRIRDEKPFVGYHAAVALLAAAREISSTDLAAVRAAVDTASQHAKPLRSDEDRVNTLRYAEQQIQRRIGH